MGIKNVPDALKHIVSNIDNGRRFAQTDRVKQQNFVRWVTGY